MYVLGRILFHHLASDGRASYVVEVEEGVCIATGCCPHEVNRLLASPLRRRHAIL
jgi:hypothetical protein